MSVKKHIRVIVSIISFIFFIVSVLPNDLQVSAQNEGVLTIISHNNSNISERPLTQPPAGTPIEGKVYHVWQIEDMSASVNEDLQAKLAALNNLSDEALDSQFGDAYVTTPSDERGVTHISLPLYQSYYVRDTDGIMLSFIVSLPSTAGNETLNDLTVYPKGGRDPETEEPGNGKLIKHGLDEEKSDSPELLEGVKFHLFNASDKDGQFPLRFINHYEFSNENSDNSTDVLITDVNGEILVKNLPPGQYYFKEIQTIPPYKLNQNPLYISIRPGETTTVTMENYVTSEGGYQFRKVNNGASPVPLAGAVFKVLNSDSEPVLVEGKEILLTSNSEGLFEINHLPLGDYYLQEVEAPIVNGVAYQLLDNLIKFTVTGSSYETERMDITNIPKGETSIPPTGDILLFLILGSAVVLILLGVLIYSRTHSESGQ